MGKKILYRKKCCGCEEDFSSSDVRKLSCSDKCYDKWYRSKKSSKGKIERKCEICDGIFLSFRYEKTKFCSSKCFGASISLKPRETSKIEISCTNCDKGFLIHGYRIGQAKFCSKTCFDEFRRKNDKCIKCGNVYRTANWNQSKYCSLECAGSAVNNRSANEIEIYNKLSETYNVLRYTINKFGRRIIPDIIIGNRIIEYNGDYWHCNPKKYSPDFFNFRIGMYAYKKWEDDSNRIKILNNAGYKVKTIWESDYKNDPEGVINDCIVFLEERMILNFKKLNDGAALPSYATKGAAGMDISACLEEELILHPKEAAIIPTGLAMELPIGYEAQIRSRSGMAINHAVVVLNSPGTIDSDYRGEIKIILINHSNKPFKITHGMRIAQMVVQFVPQPYKVTFVDEVNKTERGENGFGSTGYDVPGFEDSNDPYAITEAATHISYDHVPFTELPNKSPNNEDIKAILLMASKGEK